MRFRTKTILGVALIEMALLAVLVGSVLSILRESNETELIRRTQLAGKLLAAAAKDAVLSQDLATLDSLVGEAMASGQIDFVRILDSNGVVLSVRGNPINELLDIARIEARRGSDLVIETVLLGALVSETVSDYKVPERRDAPVVTPPAEPAYVFVDRRKLKQALTNLLSNAYKYSPEGGEVSIKFRTSSENDMRQVGVEVSDQGIGMTPEQLARVCERFYRADTSGKILGAGLGMSIVKEIIELHGGRIQLESQFGVGSAVTLWLPLSPESHSPK